MKLTEAFIHTKKKEGEIPFSKSSNTDPHILKIAGIIAVARSVPVEQVFQEIDQEKAKFLKIKDVAPILYHTISDNLVEDQLFSAFWKLDIPIEGSPKFSKIMFRRLCEQIRGEHNRFFPLRNFIEKRRHANPSYLFTDDPTDPETSKGQYASVKTACATLTGEFVFNIPFMQKLLDWAHLKDIKPKQRKYTNNGGQIPFEYAYIEFLIMHEYLHYSEGDFYYQKVIPHAKPKIINWVGDFRSNYLLVKSGYEQLPMGLFNDKINYDRQFTYKEMYDLVQSEFDKFPKKDKAGNIPIAVGQTVRMPNGKKGTVVAVRPDGTADVEEQ